MPHPNFRPTLILAALFPLCAAPSLQVTGGITVNGISQPLLFTWKSTVSVAGTGWAPGETVQVVLHGPLDSPGVAANNIRRFGFRLSSRLIRGSANGAPLVLADIPLGVVTADARGVFSASAAIPYDNGIVGQQARIPRPGLYEVRASGRVSGSIAAADRIDLCPDTHPNASANWGTDRGGRDGVFPDVFRQFSPERFDPEWPTVWDEIPVEVYGTVATADSTGSDQPSRISPSDNPPTHYAHDAIFFLQPDAGYRWSVGTANYFDEPDSPGRGRLEVEWETRNGGSTATYGQGNIGLPIWANPTVGDRVYVVGRWILDAGHPETGDRTEVHPPRLVATMRSRPAISNGAAARQVDIYVSGHGGGANWMPPGLSATLDQGGYGGGRIRDVLSPDDQARYYQAGPLAPLLYPLLVTLIRQITGVSITADIHSDAGPSAFPWGSPGLEERPINDRDYEFDVPLPAPPQGAASVALEAVNHPEHTTGVVEQVSYGPSTAHIRLPYRAADNGIYARTLKFSWRQAPPPAAHWVVRLNRIDVIDAPGKWHIWSDVSGLWTYLTGVAAQLLNTSAGASVALPASPADLYLDSGQTIRIAVHGYRAACLDDYFGKLFGQSSYVAGLTFVGACGPTDNQDLGLASLELPQQPSPKGTYTVTGPHFTVNVTVDVQ